MSGVREAPELGSRGNARPPSVYLALPLEHGLASGLCLRASQLLLRTGGQGGFRILPAIGLHLTLAFYGALSQAEIERLKLSLDASFGRNPALLRPLELELGPAGSFPATGAARVLWLGARDPEPSALSRLARTAREAAAGAGISHAEAEREFTPHITLARRARGGGHGPQAFLQHNWRGVWKPHRVSLLEARTGSDGCRRSGERWSRPFVAET